MIDKEAIGDGTVIVRFTVPAAFGAVAVVGDFNQWDPQRTRFRRVGDTSVASAVVRRGRRYAFRYVTTGGSACNDEGADDYEADALGAFHSVLDLAESDTVDVLTNWI